MCTRVRDGIVHAIFAGLTLSLLAGLPIGAHAQTAQGQMRISLVIPERAAIVTPAIELTHEGSSRLCNAHQGDALREIRYRDSDQQLKRCSPDAALIRASGRHQVLVTPI